MTVQQNVRLVATTEVKTVLVATTEVKTVQQNVRLVATTGRSCSDDIIFQ